MAGGEYVCRSRKLAPYAVLPAPLVGSLTGLLAGLYPSLRAARVEPLEALRQ
ncbi:hypothetical protein [Streptomyces sp. NBC_00236]|uniref:hypothetical protein n=1 Tax=Streptomyces sp. NBC_00236 TaxID=2903639 RepID=UPI002E2C100E|nr:hypothetical protein [Streptomyces sp. NBC_00236]